MKRLKDETLTIRTSADIKQLLKLAAAWDVAPREMVMVGDYRFDLDCGRAAGAKTVLVNLPENPWPELADWHAKDCAALRRMI